MRRPVAFCLVTAAFFCAAGLAAGQTVDAPPQGVPSDAYGRKTVVPALVACTDVPTATVPVPTLRILAPHKGDLRRSASRGEVVVLSGGTPQGLMIGQRYFARRLNPPTSRFPISATDPGSIRTTGWLTVVAADERFALARVDYACVPIDAGDYLESYEETVLPPVSGTDGPTNFSDMGRVMFGTDQRQSFGTGDVLTIDRGSARGMATGTRLAFYRDRSTGTSSWGDRTVATPLVEIGSGIVVEVLAETSKVVLDRVFPDVKTGDYFGVRGTR